MTASITDALWIAACAAMLGVAVWQDIKTGRIPNRAVLIGAVAALLLSVAPGGVGLASALFGLALGLGILAPVYALGLIGAGDVKLLAAAGAFVGFPAALALALLTFALGGVLSILWALRSGSLGMVWGNLRQGLFNAMVSVAGGALPRAADLPASPSRVPYSIAIAAGTLACALLSGRFGLSGAW